MVAGGIGTLGSYAPSVFLAWLGKPLEVPIIVQRLTEGIR